MLQSSNQVIDIANSDKTAGIHATSTIFRPIQYLGSKLRSLELLTSHTKHLYGNNDLVVDCFSGSSVVSQAFANSGAKVVSVDSQIFCQHIASAMLGISRKNLEKSAPTASAFVAAFLSLELPGSLGALLRREKALLQNRPSSELLDFYTQLPQVWKSPSSKYWLDSSIGQPYQPGFNFTPIIASHYAGTYFGLYQAVFFDYVRNQIHVLREADKISGWTEAALLTALYSAMSSCVCSAGKHFAQPLTTKTTGNEHFRLTRLHADRSINCLKIFTDAALSVDNCAQSGRIEHTALGLPFESVRLNASEMKPRLFYADPPYTAQQYSRFYHVLEVAATYAIPELQLINGKITSGLYNVNRYKSPFSSKVAAPQAFIDLIRTAKESDASIAISYSASSDESTGNCRMISLPELSKICRFHFGDKIKFIEFGHAYRPFNSGSKNNIHRDDPEILIVCET